MAKRHQGKQKPTYKSLKAQGKVMTPEGDIIKVPKKHVGRGGGKQGVKGDLTVYHRWSGVGSEGWKGETIKAKKRPKVSAKKTAKRRGPPPVLPQKAKKAPKGATGFTKRLKRAQAVHKRRVPKAGGRTVRKSKGYA